VEAVEFGRMLRQVRSTVFSMMRDEGTSSGDGIELVAVFSGAAFGVFDEGVDLA
jgi:hypothetical protein